MRVFVVHVHDAPGDDPREEAYVVVPGVERAVFPVAIDALPKALPSFALAFADSGEQRCPGCGEALATPEIVERFSGRG